MRRRGAGAAKKKRGTEAAEEEEQRSVSVIASLFQGLVKVRAETVSHPAIVVASFAAAPRVSERRTNEAYARKHRR